MSNLTAATVKTAGPGKYHDGQGLHLRVTDSGSKSWVLRLTVDGRRREIGLGGWPEVSLADARHRACDAAAMGRWYTSDHHFGHQNIIRYCDRPFPDADAMDKEMVARWNDVVADSDEVWILGDLVMGGKTQGLAGWVARLKGRKILVPGNHDRCWAGNRDHRWERADYYHIGGIHKIFDNPEPHTIAGQQVQLNHFPYKLDDRYDTKFAKWRPQDDGAWLLHGHIHEKWRQQHRQINVGVDAWNFAPVPEQTIADLIERGPADTPSPDYT